MPGKQFGTVTVEVDGEGFMTDFSQWNREIAAAIAREEGIAELTPAHWKVIEFFQKEFKENGQALEKHVYNSLGRFQVKAVDFNGSSSKVFSAEVVVAEMTPGFEIDTLEFVFANGKYYRVIAKDSPGPDYQLRVKAKGRGVLNGQFMLDNMPIGLFQILIRENQTAQLPVSQMAAE